MIKFSTTAGATKCCWALSFACPPSPALWPLTAVPPSLGFPSGAPFCLHGGSKGAGRTGAARERGIEQVASGSDTQVGHRWSRQMARRVMGRQEARRVAATNLPAAACAGSWAAAAAGAGAGAGAGAATEAVSSMVAGCHTTPWRSSYLWSTLLRVKHKNTQFVGRMCAHMSEGSMRERQGAPATRRQTAAAATETQRPRHAPSPPLRPRASSHPDLPESHQRGTWQVTHHPERALECPFPSPVEDANLIRQGCVSFVSAQRLCVW
jgi:hypothetical protein